MDIHECICFNTMHLGQICCQYLQLVQNTNVSSSLYCLAVLQPEHDFPHFSVAQNRKQDVGPVSYTHLTLPTKA